LYNHPIDCVIPSLVTWLNEDVGDRNARDGLLDVVSDLRERLMGGFGINLSESVELQYLHYLAVPSHDDREIRDVVDASSDTGWHQWNEVKGRGGNRKDGDDNDDNKDEGFWASMLHHLIWRPLRLVLRRRKRHHD
jgi:hypothetical protein